MDAVETHLSTVVAQKAKQTAQVVASNKAIKDQNSLYIQEQQVKINSHRPIYFPKITYKSNCRYLPY
jgi:hypothetical protein